MSKSPRERTPSHLVIGLAKVIVFSMIAMVTAISCVAIWKHDSLPEVTRFVASVLGTLDSIVMLLVGGGGVAVGAYGIRQANRETAKHIATLERFLPPGADR